MNKELQEEYRNLIIKAKTYKRKSLIIEKRNQIYLLLMPYLEKWVKTILKKWAKYESEQEVRSLTWDCFLFCYERYSNYNVPITYFFYYYSRYHLLHHYASKDKITINMDELHEVLTLIPTEFNYTLDNFITLLQYRSVLPKNHVIAWDDAIESLSPNYAGRKMSKIIGINKFYYYQLKKSFVEIIKLIMNIK